MALWNKLFGKESSNGRSTDDTPDNTRLMELLNKYASTRDYKDYKRVYHELENGRSFLLLPSHEEAHVKDGWRKTAEGETLQLTSIFQIDGLKVLGAFTDEAAVLSWSKKPTTNVAMPSKSVLEMCYTERSGRIVINTGLDTMFVLERDSDAFHSTTLQAGSMIREGVPARPLDKATLEKMAHGLHHLEIVDEAFHYAKNLNGDDSLVIALRLARGNENAKKAAMLAIHDVLKGVSLDQPLDIYFIEKEEPYRHISGISGARFYKRSES